MKGIIFDKDGVLIDSELGKMEAMRQALSSLNVDLSKLEKFEEWYLGRVGVPGVESCERFIHKYSINFLDPIKLYDRVESIRKEMIVSAPAPSIKNNIDFLKSIPRDKFKIGISSSDFYSNIITHLKGADIFQYFDAITSGEKSAGEVKRDKPFPDIYLLTAKKLGVSPENCIGIEDTDAGINAVKSAGIFCIAYRNPNSGKQTLADADIITDDLTKINLESLF